MNKLFEEFVFEVIKKTGPEWSFIAQKGKKLLDGDNNNKQKTFVNYICGK